MPRNDYVEMDINKNIAPKRELISQIRMESLALKRSIAFAQLYTSPDEQNPLFLKDFYEVVKEFGINERSLRVKIDFSRPRSELRAQLNMLKMLNNLPTTKFGKTREEIKGIEKLQETLEEQDITGVDAKDVADLFNVVGHDIMEAYGESEIATLLMPDWNPYKWSGKKVGLEAVRTYNQMVAKGVPFNKTELYDQFLKNIRDLRS